MHKSIHSYVDRWRHKIRKYAAEIFQNINNRMQT